MSRPGASSSKKTRWMSRISTCRTATNPGLSRKCRSVCAPQSGDCHQFPPLELAGCTRLALRETLRLAVSPETVKHSCRAAAVPPMVSYAYGDHHTAETRRIWAASRGARQVGVSPGRRDPVASRQTQTHGTLPAHPDPVDA